MVSAWLNEDVSTVLHCIKGAHSLDEGYGRHPDPTRTGGIHVHNANRVGLGVICTKRRDMAAASLTHVLSPVVDDDVITGTLEVFQQIRANFLLGFFVINHDQPSDKIMRPE